MLTHSPHSSSTLWRPSTLCWYKRSSTTWVSYQQISENKSLWSYSTVVVIVKEATSLQQCICYAWHSLPLPSWLGVTHKKHRTQTFSRPVLPADYQRSIKQGFSTDYFKTVPAMEYRPENIQDIYDRGFRNLRLRVRADLYCPPYDNNNILFTWFLGKLEEVVDRCLEVGVAPIISWIHHEAEAFATEEDRRHYVEWWTKVAEKLKRKNTAFPLTLWAQFTYMHRDSISS